MMQTMMETKARTTRRMMVTTVLARADRIDLALQWLVAPGHQLSMSMKKTSSRPSDHMSLLRTSLIQLIGLVLPLPSITECATMIKDGWMRLVDVESTSAGGVGLSTRTRKMVPLPLRVMKEIQLSMTQVMKMILKKSILALLLPVPGHHLRYDSRMI
jgi:hypothetical protein